jgi:hypothetical protein
MQNLYLNGRSKPLLPSRVVVAWGLPSYFTPPPSKQALVSAEPRQSKQLPGTSIHRRLAKIHKPSSYSPLFTRISRLGTFLTNTCVAGLYEDLPLWLPRTAAAAAAAGSNHELRYRGSRRCEPADPAVALPNAAVRHFDRLCAAPDGGSAAYIMGASTGLLLLVAGEFIPVPETSFSRY